MTQICQSTKPSTTYWTLPKFLSRSNWCLDTSTSVLTQTEKRQTASLWGRVHLPYLTYRDVIVNNETLSVADRIVRTKMCSHDVRLVVIRTRPQPSKRYKYFCLFTSDLQLSVADMIRHYKNRWQIETAFRDAKQEFGFDTYQLRSRKSLNRFVQMSFIAASLTQISFTNRATAIATETPSEEQDTPPNVETVLSTLGIHWYKPKRNNTRVDLFLIPRN